MPAATYLVHPLGVVVPDHPVDGIDQMVLRGGSIVEIDDTIPPWFGILPLYVSAGLLIPVEWPTEGLTYPTLGAALLSLPTWVADGAVVARRIAGLGQVMFAYSTMHGWEPTTSIIFASQLGTIVDAATVSLLTVATTTADETLNAEVHTISDGATLTLL